MPILSTDATRGEVAALPEDALTTAALNADLRIQSVPSLAGAPAPPAPGTGRAYKTGVGGAAPGRKEDTWLSDTLLDGLSKGLDLTKDALKRYGTKEGREEGALNKAFQEAFEAMVKAEGTALVEKVPFGKVILVSFELSLAFAEGVGKALDKVNAELAKKYDFSRLGAELDEDDLAQLQAMRGYLAEGTRQLGRIVGEGLAEVAQKAVEMLLEKLGEVPGKILDDVAGQVARQLCKRHDLLAIFREAVEEASKSIPDGRGKVERLAFNFVGSAFLNQLSDKELQEKLAGLPEVAKEGPVDVNLLGSVIKILVQGSYDNYARNVNVAYVQSEAKQLLIQTARQLAAGLVDVKLEVSDSENVVIETGKIGVPTTWLPTLAGPPEPDAPMRNRFWGREKELMDYSRRLKLWLDVRKGRYRKQWKRLGAQGDVERWNLLQDKWLSDWRQAHRNAAEAIQAIVEEFGEGWSNGTIRTQLEFDVILHLGREREAVRFAPPPL